MGSSWESISVFCTWENVNNNIEVTIVIVNNNIEVTIVIVNNNIEVRGQTWWF